MTIPSSTHLLAMKLMALALVLTLMISFPHDAEAASGGAMGGGFLSRGASRYSSSSRSRYDYPTRSSSTYVYREYRGGCCGSRLNYSPLNGMQQEHMEVFVYSFVAMSGIFLLVFIVMTYFDKDQTKTSVVKLQVALKGTACSLQQDLNHIALKADTSTQEGYKHVLEESAKVLLRHSEFWILSYLSENIRSDEHQAERLFYELSFEERSKFDEETLVNIDNNSHQEQKSTSEVVSTSASPFIVVNLLVATARKLNLSPINTVSDLKNVLKELGGLAKSEILAAHVLWTPQDENDSLSPERLLHDYPLLMDLRSKLD